jgi:phosphoenolpyruvate carboxylase
MTEMTLLEILEAFEEAYLITEYEDLGLCCEEIQQEGYWVGGDEDGDGFISDSNTYFATPGQAQLYYSRMCKRFWAYEDEQDRDEAWEKMGGDDAARAQE